MAREVEHLRRGLTRPTAADAAVGTRLDPHPSTQAWARTRLAVNLLMQGQHRHAQAELNFAQPVMERLAPGIGAPVGPKAEVATLARRALYRCARTLADAPLSVRVEPVIDAARAALADCTQLVDSGAEASRWPAWAMAVADTWLDLDPDPTPASRASIWSAIEPIWRWPQAIVDPAALPWLVRLAHRLAQIGPVEAGRWNSIVNVLHRALQEAMRATASPGLQQRSSTARLRALNGAVPTSDLRTLLVMPLGERAATRHAVDAADDGPLWHPLARARDARPPDLRLGSDTPSSPAHQIPLAPAPIAVPDISPWRIDTDALSHSLAMLPDLPLSGWAAASALPRPSRSSPLFPACARSARPTDLPTLATWAANVLGLARRWQGSTAARGHLVAARLSALAGDDAAAASALHRACGLRLARGGLDHLHARALLSHLATRCLRWREPLPGFGLASLRRRAVHSWLRSALPEHPSARLEATQQAELAALAGDRDAALRWHWEAVASARFERGALSVAHLEAMQALRDALAELDPEHPDLEHLHDEGTELARRLLGPLSAEHWWWRGMRALWWQAQGHGGALRALGHEAEECIEGTIAAGDAAACACMLELIDAARQASRRRSDEPAFGPNLTRVQ